MPIDGDTPNRKPILLSKNTCALILLFTRYDSLMDVCMGAYDNFNGHEVWKEAAKEFVKQLDDRWCETFLEALVVEIQGKLAQERQRRMEDLPTPGDTLRAMCKY